MAHPLQFDVVEYVRFDQAICGFILQFFRVSLRRGSVRYSSSPRFCRGLLLFHCGRLAWRRNSRGGSLHPVFRRRSAASISALVWRRRFDDFWLVLSQDSDGPFNLTTPTRMPQVLFFAHVLSVRSRWPRAAQRSRVLYFPAPSMAAGLWISGSRTALLAGAVAAGVLAGASVRTQMGRRGRYLNPLVSVVLAAGVLAVIYAPTRGNQKAASIAARVRIEMAQTTLRMVSSRPFFGIGWAILPAQVNSVA